MLKAKINNMEKTRLFIALDLPAATQEKVYKICNDIKGIRWIKRGQLHLTLCFIGDTNFEMIQQLSDALKRLNFRSFDLIISRAKFFRAGIFSLELEKSAALISLKEQIDNILHQVSGLEFDLRVFLPHITLARFKRRLSSTKLKILTQSFEPLFHENFTVDKLILYSSKTSLNGAIYSQLAVVNAIKNQ